MNNHNWWTKEMERLPNNELNKIFKNMEIYPPEIALKGLNQMRLKRLNDNLEFSDIFESNNYIINLIKNNIPFSIIRTGLGGAEITTTYKLSKNDNIDKKDLYHLETNAGIYGIKNNEQLKKYCDLYENSIKNCTAIVNWETKHDIYFSKLYNLKNFQRGTSQILHYFQSNICQEKDMFDLNTPWTLYLYGKKVLIINPFIKSIKKQLKKKFRFSNNNFFHKDQEFIFYKCYNTITGNHIHKNWYETYCIMCNDITKIDFDIALVSCGGYGLPLCDFIHKNLNKSAFYIGGQLQLFFGITGNRWVASKNYKKRINNKINNYNNFIYVEESERVSNYKLLEQGAYF